MSHGRPAILAEGLEKSYGKNRALRGLDLAAEEGTVLGLFGPNGAGKTTAVRILATLLRPDAGRAEVAGLDVVQEAERLRPRIGLTG
jgi:ABC-2 type transport system ATP-binding protein